MLSSHQKRQILGRPPLAAAPQGLPRRAGTALLLALCLTGLAGCGQKGPLYLPGNPALPGAPSPTATPNDDLSNDPNNNPAVTR